MSTKDKTPAPFLNPYFGGILLGVILLMTFYITGRGLGATGAIKSSVIATVQEISPQHANESDYYNLFIREDRNTLNTWLVFEAIGLIAGAFLSGALSRRLTWKVEHSPKITSRTRLIFAFLGGALFGIGSQFARGCTSGAALSGSAVLATSGFLAMISIFGSAYLFAYFARKLWI
ncbi:MAG: YeeE/YedE family protein [Saprospiraceae bacterium]|nr:YeeE/YedE family protein [Saprospiraceae bacterium]MCB9325320.1 YeeE/YedE family protein [Lewinellaceae bacterium]